jgi:hypothetical protein
VSILSHGLEQYTLEELYDLENNIYKLKFPEKYESVLSLIHEKEKALQASPEYVMAAQSLKENEEVAEKNTHFFIYLSVYFCGRLFVLSC